VDDEVAPPQGQPRASLLFSMSTGLAKAREAKASELATKAYFILAVVVVGDRFNE